MPDRDTVTVPREVLEATREALSRCYDVCEWPSDGSTRQDAALRLLTDVLSPRPSSDPEGGARGEYSSLQEANIARQKEWDPDNRITLAYRGNELAGEVGEACNVIKKLERERLGINGSRDTVEHLLEELADSVICSYLVAMHVGGDLEAAIVAKFNATSEKMNLKTRLRLTKSDGSACGNYSQASQRHNSDLQPGPSDQLTKTPSADRDDGNLRGLSAPNHQPHAVSQGWPVGCRNPASCDRHQACMYANCKFENVDIRYAIAIANLPAPPSPSSVEER